VVLGVGSELRSDDAVGLRAASLLQEMNLAGVRVINGGPAPENTTAEIRALSPSFVFILDAADMGDPPGIIRVLTSAEEAGAAGAAFGTHGLPLSVLAGYLRSELGCGVTLVGIQPQSVEYGEALTAAAEAAAGELAEALGECLG
jgi:hydrogenase 3 maturation protease